MRGGDGRSLADCEKDRSYPPFQMLAHIVHTNEATERLVRDNLHLSRHVQEEIVGPRYCPSIESKVQRFPGRPYQIILEPEGTFYRWSQTSAPSVGLASILMGQLVAIYKPRQDHVQLINDEAILMFFFKNSIV